MPDAERGHGNKRVAAAMQRVFRSQDGLRPAHDLPQPILDKLAELDRAAAQKRAAEGGA